MKPISHVIFIAIFLLLGAHPSYSASVSPPEEIWKSLEKLPAAEREKKLIEGAKRQVEML